ncbi:hypothetical protein EVAR_75023_1 [Eumeta japonica]|uniref:Uncharacterized protein n=1 Tax=Eumeta variegata TaxID=151549 RepID=A0A4C1W374_EUMVA|nr:hypothetical protein EVAR_75023_1 [Eumeta japonica]
MGPPDGGRPIPIRKITNWKRSTALEKIDTPNLNSIPNDIASTDVIDSANHVRTVVEERAGALMPRAHPTPEYRSRARALQREVKARVREFQMRVGATYGGNQTIPQSAFGHQRLKTEGYTLYPHSKPDNSVAIDDAEIAECLADSIETQCLTPLRTTSFISVASRKRFSQNPNRKTIWLPSHSSEVQTLVKSLIRERHRAAMSMSREGFETERSTCSCLFDVAKAFDRQTDFTFRHERTPRQDVLSEQEFLKAPPSLLCCTPRTQMYHDRRRLASNSRYSRTIPRSFTEVGTDSPSSRGPLTS